MSSQPHLQPVPENHLLGALQVHERNAVQRGSVVVACTPGQTLLDANTHTNHVFFPIDAVVALVRKLDDGNAIELGIAGNDGMIGCDAFSDAKTGLDEAIVRSPGNAWCMPAEDFRRQFHRGGGLQKALLRFMTTFVSQLAQNASCNRFHSIEGRVARWLL
ncbi:MAG TPA: Crp/Fnr family transcriptional regulator, partial [Thermoanaerobaculia bacterium]|nr:Crp/Fnr family transcriptional regulator [Thermoanaerobaculia bacterium]